MRKLLFLFFIFCLFSFSAKAQKKQIDIVKSNRWFIAGPSKESEEMINSIRVKKGIITVTAKDNPQGEIELNVMIT